jgi:hypothetical protein
MIFIFIFTILATSALLLGLLSMAIGQKYNKKFATKLMSLRVFFQALAILSLAIAYIYH